MFEINGAVLVPEMCISAHQREAIEHGACLHFNDGLSEWNYNSDTDTYVLTTEKKQTYQAKKLVFSVGAWANHMYGSELPFELRVERRVMHWFNPIQSEDEAMFTNIPVYIWETNDGTPPFYGFPSQGKEGLKVASHGHPHYPDATTDKVEDLKIEVDQEEVDIMRQSLKGRVPLLEKGAHLSSVSCMYTFTPNEHFLLDWHPKHNKRVLLVSPCSGHGFKFGSVIGHCCASLLTKGEYDIDISLFGIEKLNGHT